MDELPVERDKIINLNFLFIRAWKEHAVDLIAIWPIKQDWLPIERLHQNILSLVQTAKYQVIKAKTAAFFQT